MMVGGILGRVLVIVKKKSSAHATHQFLLYSANNSSVILSNVAVTDTMEGYSSAFGLENGNFWVVKRFWELGEPTFGLRIEDLYIPVGGKRLVNGAWIGN